MNPELFNRLRRFGDTVDQAAVSAGAPDGPLRDVSDEPGASVANTAGEAAALEPVVPTTGWRHRHVRTIVAAAAALIIVVAGAVVLARLTRSPDHGRAVASTEGPALVVEPSETTAPRDEKHTAGTTSTSSPTAVAATSAPVTSESTTSTSTTTSTTRPSAPPVCPTYTFNSQYPIKLCNRGVAVELIQGRLGLPVDGLFGPNTQRAVREFQSANGLEVDGLVGQNTWAALGLNPPGTDLDGDNVIDPQEIE